MLFFGVSLATGVAALLIAQKMDIECEKPVERKAVLFLKKKNQKDSFTLGFGRSSIPAIES